MCCYRAQNLLILKPSQLSFTSESVVCAGMICTDDTWASRWQCYLSQNLGLAVAGSSGPAPPPLQRVLFECC